MFQSFNRIKQKIYWVTCYLLHVAWGFTLIELIIVISVLTLFFGFSLAMYNDFNETKKLEAETKKLVEVLELAKKKIISGDKSALSDDYSSCDLIAYKVIITSDKEYKLSANVCKNNDTSCRLQSDCTDVDVFNYKTSLQLIPSSLPPFPIVFKPFGLGADVGADVTETTVTIKNNNNSQCRQVTVKISGNIGEQKIVCE